MTTQQTKEAVKAVSDGRQPATIAPAPDLTGGSLSSILKTPAVKARFNDVLKDKAEGFVASVLAVVNNNALLAKATPLSVISAAMVAASLDLPITPGLGYAAIVPFKNGKEGRTDAQFQLMARGYVQLAMRSGQYKAIEVQPVCEGEIRGFQKFTGRYDFGKRKSDKVVGWMGYFRLANGFEKFFYMPIEDIQQHAMRFSQTAKKGYGLWVDNFDAMAAKTVLKLMLAKWGVLSVEMQKATTFDGSVGTDADGEPVFGEEQPAAAIPQDNSAAAMVAASMAGNVG